MGDTGRSSRNIPIGYLRVFVTLLVLLHHSLLAYVSAAPRPPGPFAQLPLLWTVFPVADPARAPGFDLIAGFNDIFFMSLMFFVSGLFVPQSLQRQGAGGFLRARILRLGIPFMVAAGLIAPLAYYPAWLQSGGAPDVSAFWLAWRSLPYWPAGPAWFLWVLLVLGAAATFVHALRLTGTLAKCASGARQHPWRFFFGLFAISALTYVLLSLVYNPYRWLTFGPFAVQASRMLHYAIYYFAGLAVGAYGLDNGLLAADGKLARRWWLWLILAPIAFFALMAIVIAAVTVKGQPMAMWEVVGGVLFALSCAVTSFALTALFTRFVRHGNAVFDSLARNAYGMYIVHYAFVSWIQFALLRATGLGGAEKGAAVFVSVVILSWATTALLRRIPAIARII